MTCAFCGADPSAGVVAAVTLRVAAEIRSENEHRAYSHPMVRHRETKRARGVWRMLLMAEARRQRFTAPAETVCRAVLTRYHHPRSVFDFDNLVGGFKVVVDALRDAKLIENDTTKWFDPHYKQERGEPGISIRLEYLA